MITPVIKGVSYVLTHTPSLVRYGSKTTREIEKDEKVLDQILGSLRSFEEAVAYAPNQVFIGNMRPEDLQGKERPWTNSLVEGATRYSRNGEILPEDEFYGWLKIADEFDLVMLEENFLEGARSKLESHSLIQESDLQRLRQGYTREQIEEKLALGTSVPLYVNKVDLIGCILTGHEDDHFLTAHILLENLCNKASGIIAMRHALSSFDVTPQQVDYVIGCDEEAVGDRYQRGGGNMAKAIAEMSNCVNASGADLKSFCCAPTHAITVAASLVQSGLYNEVVVIGGGCLAKLGMKFRGHIDKGMPIMEDQMGAIAIIVGKDDGKSPKVRLDCVGKHEISAGSSAQAIYQSLVINPLQRVGKKIVDVDKFAVEMHNPDITEPNGNGNVPRTNYRTIASMAVLKGEMDKSEIAGFEDKHGMLGFSPTQGHIAAAIPFLGHARNMIMNNEINNAMFVAKGSLFLGKMTKLSDGMSFLIEKNER
jgi:hypothetical protein